MKRMRAFGTLTGQLFVSIQTDFSLKTLEPSGYVNDIYFTAKNLLPSTSKRPSISMTTGEQLVRASDVDQKRLKLVESRGF